MTKTLGMIAAAALLIGTPAAAENAAAETEATPEPREIHRGSLAWRSPVLARDPSLIRTVERAELEATGRTDVGEALRRVPAALHIRH